MRRRDAVAAIVVLGIAPCIYAQSGQSARPFRIGVVTKLTPQGRARLAIAFAKHRWTEGREYVLVSLDADQTDRPDEDVRTILAKGIDLLIVYLSASAVAAHRQTKTTPIVMFLSGYPVEAGVADSLARPGRNVTGNATYASLGIWGKLVELLRDAKHGIRRVGMLWDYVPPTFTREEIAPIAKELSEAESRLGVTIHRVDIERKIQLADALKAIDLANVDALVLTSGPVLWGARQQVLQFAERRRLPTVSDFLQPPEDKGLRPLLVYSPSVDAARDNAIEYVVRILRDRAKPGELPIRLPARFELVVTQTTAKAIGLTVPPALLLRADRVIE
jgi:putative tryptophan/tyrosine transport system substrate-binding protein